MWVRVGFMGVVGVCACVWGEEGVWVEYVYRYLCVKVCILMCRCVYVYDIELYIERNTEKHRIRESCTNDR